MASSLTASRVEMTLPGASALAWARANWELVLLVVLAGAVYQPWGARYLPLTDFGIFFAERGISHSLWSQFVGISSYYVADGRLLLIEYLYMTLGSGLFGFSAAGWHWSYFVLMGSVLVLARSFFLISGANRTATFLALALFATMGPVADGWIEPTSEPIALIFFLVALHKAVNYCDAEDWKRRAVLIGACAVGVVFAKELLVVLVPAVWLVTRLRIESREWKWVAWSERDTFLLKVVCTCVALAFVPVAYVHFTATTNNDPGPTGPLHLWRVTSERLESVLIPSVPRLRRLVNLVIDPGFTLLLTLPSLLWIRLFVGGIATGPRKRIMWPVIIAAVWVFLGLAIYFPWGRRAGYYLIPFALGTMFAAAHAFTLLLERSKSARWACIVVTSLLLLLASFEARTIFYQHQRPAQLNAELINRIAVFGGTRDLIAATPNPATGRAAWSSHLRGLGSASTGMRVLQNRDVSCADAKRILENQRNVIVVSAASGCGKLSPTSEFVSATVPMWQWPRLWQKNTVEGRMYITGN